MKVCQSINEAKTKWCPFAGKQRAQRQDELCIADECMAWRWVVTHINDAPGGDLYPTHDTHGVCGLAGGVP